MSDSGGLAGLFWAIAAVWGLVALIYYVWFLWSLSRLFPKIGLTEREGWIPILSHKRLLERGGYPGWLVWLLLVPVLGWIVLWIVTILAMHRLNTEFGKGAAFTVLGALFGPVWAMALAHGIDALGPRASAMSPTHYRPAGYDTAGLVAGQGVAVATPVASTPAEGSAALSDELPPVPPAEIQRDAIQNDWGFSNTTIDAYERLAAEPVDVQRPVGEVVQPLYTWPEQWDEVLESDPESAAPEPARDPMATPEPSPDPEPASASEPSLDPEDDRTVVVPVRRRWALQTADGEVHELVADELVIGRKPEADGHTLKLADPTRTVSKTHARLRRDGDEWTIEDLRSTNGVAIFDAQGAPQRIDPEVPVPVTEKMLVGTLEVTLREL